HIEGLKSRSAAVSRRILCAIVCGSTEGVGSVPPRFRTIQVCPKDLRASLWQADVPENRAHGPVGGLIAHRGGSPHARHETAPLHHAARLRGCSVAARGARAASRRCPWSDFSTAGGPTRMHTSWRRFARA